MDSKKKECAIILPIGTITLEDVALLHTRAKGARGLHSIVKKLFGWPG